MSSTSSENVNKWSYTSTMSPTAASSYPYPRSITRPHVSGRLRALTAHVPCRGEFVKDSVRKERHLVLVNLKGACGGLRRPVAE